MFANPKVLFTNPKVLFANPRVLLANLKVLLANPKALLANPKALLAIELNLVGGTNAEYVSMGQSRSEHSRRNVFSAGGAGKKKLSLH